VFRTTAGLASSIRRFDRAAFALEKLLAIDPGDLESRKALAMALLDNQRYKQAAEEFGRLRELGMSEKEVLFNHGASLSNAGKARESLAVYRELAARHPDWFPGIVACAQLLRALGQSDEAFRILHRVRETFWSEPAFLTQYTCLGHAASREDEAGEALRRLDAAAPHGAVLPSRGGPARGNDGSRGRRWAASNPGLERGSGALARGRPPGGSGRVRPSAWGRGVPGPGWRWPVGPRRSARGVGLGQPWVHLAGVHPLPDAYHLSDEPLK
jgi:tetratricopeptide (TPR) repeat protein